MTLADAHEYPVILRPLSAEEGGGWLAEVPDLPGCMSDGETQPEALRNVRDAIASWIESAQHVSKPVPRNGEAVKFVQRLPSSLHLRLSMAARSEGVSLNTYINSLLAEGIGRRSVVPGRLRA